MTNQRIHIKPSPTADTRTCDWSNVSKEQLKESSVQHIDDVAKGLAMFADMIETAATHHDFDKLSDIDGFHRDFQTGFVQTTWWDNHRKVNRHHLNVDNGIPDDVNLVDVLDYIVDCIMAGMARSGSVYPLEISDETLRRAFSNTVELLKSRVVVST